MHTEKLHTTPVSVYTSASGSPPEDRRPVGATTYFDMSWNAFAWGKHVVGTCVTVLIGLFWAAQYGVTWSTFRAADFHPLLPLATYLVMFAAHELIHAVTSKVLEPSQRVYFAGFHRGMVTVRSEGLCNRKVYLATLLAPLLLLSIALPAALMGHAGGYAWLVVMVAALNAMTSAADVTLALATVMRVPRGALVDGCEDELYYVEEKTAPAHARAVEITS